MSSFLGKRILNILMSCLALGESYVLQSIFYLLRFALVGMENRPMWHGLVGRRWLWMLQENQRQTGRGKWDRCWVLGGQHQSWKQGLNIRSGERHYRWMGLVNRLPLSATDSFSQCYKTQNITCIVTLFTAQFQCKWPALHQQCSLTSL